MPRFDGTGPGGQGCKTGRGMGKCRGNNQNWQPGAGAGQNAFRGPGSGCGRGAGKGAGKGSGNRGSGKGNNPRGGNWQ